MAFSVIYDPNWNEPAPRKYHAIRCFSCKHLVANKTEAGRNHRGHEIFYIDEKGNKHE